MKTQSFVKGAAVLTVSTMIVKIIGMLYKIPLGNLLGGTGMAYFMTAYNIFNPVYALSVAGFPTAVAKKVAESTAKHRYNDARRIFSTSYVLFIITGFIGFSLMFWGAKSAAALIGSRDAYLSVAAMAPAIFFCCIVSAYRGYYQGLGNMTPTAVSQVIESVFRMICGVAIAMFILNRAMAGFDLTGMVFGQKAPNREQAILLTMPRAAAGAILGVTVSSMISALYLTARHLIRGDGITGEMIKASPKPQKISSIAGGLAAFALPVCIGSVLTNITALIDVATIMNRIGAAMDRGGGVILAMHAGLIPEGLAGEDVPQYLFGAYSYCSSLFNLIPALTIPLGISALPLISSHWALGNRFRTGETVHSVLKLSSLIAIPAGLGLSALSGPVLELLYPARLQEAAIAAPILRSLGIAAVFLGVTAPVSSVFQALGRADIPVKLMAAGAAIKTCMNYYLLAVPRFNIHAAPYGTILCYFSIFIFSLILLQNIVKLRINVAQCFFKPLFCGMMCALSANTSYAMFSKLLSSRVSCLLSLVIGGTIYAIFVLFLKILTRSEILLLPQGKKIAKILEKLSFLG